MRGRSALAGAMAAALHVGPALADPAVGANLGGGFIELLMTGRSPGRPYHQAAPAPAPRRERAYVPAYAPPLDDYSPRRPLRESIPVEPARQAALAPDYRQPDYRQAERAIDPVFLPQVVDYDGRHAPGTIIIDTPRRFLFLVEGEGRARRYGIGVGRPGFEWAGVKSITRKAEWPDWRPPPEMLKRRPDLPRFMAGGPENPMGARGLYLGSSLYRIHGTNEPHTIGQAVSSGCIRMRNEDVTDLYERVRVGTKVIVI
jgi:lipoprotein-anchoring transpeptidase ErfK/SrfK